MDNKDKDILKVRTGKEQVDIQEKKDHGRRKTKSKKSKARERVSKEITACSFKLGPIRIQYSLEKWKQKILRKQREGEALQQ